jgi:hypothetical protein
VYPVALNDSTFVFFVYMSVAPFNCSTRTSKYAYNSSQSTVVSLQLCHLLLKDQCLNLGLDASYCDSSHSDATGAKALSMHKAGFCDTYRNNSDQIWVTVFGSVVIFLFILNCIRFIHRSRRGSRAPSTSELQDSVLVQECSASATAPDFVQAEDQHHRHMDSLGTFGHVLPLVGLQWMLAPLAHSYMRKFSRAAFLSGTALA